MAKIEFKNISNIHYPLGMITMADEERTKELEEQGFSKLLQEKKVELKKK